MNWDKIIFWFDAEEDKIYWSRFEFIKVNKKLKSLTKSVHHVRAVDFSPDIGIFTTETVFMNMNWLTKIVP